MRLDLRVVMGGAVDDLWISDTPLGASRNAMGTSVWGLSETLTRVLPTGEVTCWLAESVRMLDPLTWRITLRRNARFWNGAPVDARAVRDCFMTNWDVQRDADLLISRDTRVEALDDTTLEFGTREPIGHFVNALAHPQLAIHADAGRVMTGPYQPRAIEEDRFLRLHAFADHWAGRPALEMLTVTVMPDLDDRIRALESSAADLVYGFPAEAVSQLADLARRHAVLSTPSIRLHFLQLNMARPPFDDRRVREATSFALDRAALVSRVLLGHGAAARGMFPDSMGGEVLPSHQRDVTRAAQLLDEAGWRWSADGFRYDAAGQRLSFELCLPIGDILAMTPLGVALKDQLRQSGIDVRLLAVPSLGNAAKNGNFDAVMRSSVTLFTGDPYCFLKVRLAGDGAHDAERNPGGYRNPHFEVLLDELRRETDQATRHTRASELQRIAGADVPIICLVFMPTIVVAGRGKLPHFTPDPNNEYFIHHRLGT